MSDFTDNRFQTTCWTQVLSAKGESTVAREALEVLCDSYYEPVVAYLARAGYERSGTARDLAHDFFSELLKGGQMEHLDREKGRFRSYLLGALKHFLAHQRARHSALKRGAGSEHVSLNENSVGTAENQLPAGSQPLPPDVWFDRQWAMALLAQALGVVEAECKAAGNETQFTYLSPWLIGEAEHGDQIDLAKKTGLSPGSLKSLIHRLKKRFRHAVKEEIARTIANSEDVEAEMQALFAALRNDGGK